MLVERIGGFESGSGEWGSNTQAVEYQWIPGKSPPVFGLKPSPRKIEDPAVAKLLCIHELRSSRGKIFPFAPRNNSAYRVSLRTK